ncbi:hypothetical protein CVT24_012893 [Panaeolus cyanescens]|uniref:F-box domain-containing protein n=1 Tax=Panaeolus cyanescens TaxID=181874 RepID=A0A409W2T2_9AGAR|nr:hypothetical protein CVT24_012893 [Panaeolus cyanescens]
MITSSLPHKYEVCGSDSLFCPVQIILLESLSFLPPQSRRVCGRLCLHSRILFSRAGGWISRPRHCSQQGVGYAPHFMELTLEAYRNIVRSVGNRADISTLCRVCQGFRNVAEKALYNTLFLQDDEGTELLCRTLAGSPRLAFLVDALTISIESEDEDDTSSEKSDMEDTTPLQLPESFWPSIALALESTTQLRYLNIHLPSDGNFSNSLSWVLKNTTFKLRKFHCDLAWDSDLVLFLKRQTLLEDLYIQDYVEGHDPPVDDSHSQTIPPTLDTQDMPRLSMLECTFSEAAIALVPGRPITHLKTCFSRDEPNSKREEMSQLLSRIARSTQPLKSIDIGDSLYSEAFSIELLTAIVNTKAMKKICYLGTLALPVHGRERLQFYGLLMRLPIIQCVEFEVSQWEPPPSSHAALRALASELRLYVPSINKVIFVNDFDRSVVTAFQGICRVDVEISTDLLWREK